MDKPVLPACYLPPISYVQTLLERQSTGVWIEQHEHFPKQTYRNRASIYGANGKLDLIIPVRKGRAEDGNGTAVHTKMQDVQISYEANWQRLHWMTLQTAYRSSAYFEFYEDDFADFYQKPTASLLEFNFNLTKTILRLLKVNVDLELTERYNKEYPDELDFREAFNPKKLPKQESPTKPYHQVFGDRYGFIPDLSIVDLLFNFGPQSLLYLKRS
jgi:hypothetical protein